MGKEKVEDTQSKTGKAKDRKRKRQKIIGYEKTTIQKIVSLK